ncbi:hypothetical protein ACFL96_19395 [Thermoproteota archaeon]
MINDVTKIMDYTSNKLEDERVFEMMGAEKLESLNASIEDIQEAIKMRKHLSDQIVGLFTKVLVDTDNFIIKLHTVDRNNDIVRGEQMRIKQKAMDIEAKKIEEQVNCWRDVALLKKELREHLAEFREREGRSNMLDSLLDGDIV